MAAFNLSRKQQQKLSLFLGCLIISFLCWSLFALSNRYLYNVDAAVKYVNVPPQRAFHPLQSDTVTMRVEGSGWQVLFSSLRFRPHDVEVDLSGLKTRDWILFSSQLGYINRQFDANQRIVSVMPDTLFFNFSKQSEKRVPVKLSYDLEFRKQYDITSDVEISPKFVRVTGPVEDLVRIESWATDTLRRTDVEQNIQAKVGLQRMTKANISVYPTVVDAKIPVGEVTEKIIQVPIRAENYRPYRSVKILPEKVTLTLLVPLDRYAAIQPENFEAVININDWKANNISDLPVLITRSPEYTRIVRMSPQNIQFLLDK